MIFHFYNIPIGTVKKVVLKLFWERKVCTSLWKLVTLFKAEIEYKKCIVY